PDEKAPCYYNGSPLFSVGADVTPRPAAASLAACWAVWAPVLVLVAAGAAPPPARAGMNPLLTGAALPRVAAGRAGALAPGLVAGGVRATRVTGRGSALGGRTSGDAAGNPFCQRLGKRYQASSAA